MASTATYIRKLTLESISLVRLSRRDRIPVSKRERVFFEPSSKRPTNSLNATICALFITLGLCAGVFALIPQSLLVKLPVLSIAVAFFVPLTMLFAFTSLRLRLILQTALVALLATVLAGGSVVAAAALGF